MARPAPWQNLASSDPSHSGGWDAFWRRTDQAAAHRAGGPQDEVLARFWTAFFTAAFGGRSAARCIDLASGNGAVLHHARAAGAAPAALVGVDHSVAALADLERRIPGACGVAAHAARTPFPPATFAIVSSQFGVEYAGPDALEEAARLVAPGGVLGAVLHLKEGVIYRECLVNAQAMEQLRAFGLLTAGREAFAAAASGEAGRIQPAEAALRRSFEAMEALLREAGSGVAGGAILALCRDLDHMYMRRHAFDLREVLNWLGDMERETRAYASRMDSMLAVALDAKALDEAVTRITRQGLTVRLREPMVMGVVRPAAGAWVLVADRA